MKTFVKKSFVLIALVMISLLFVSCFDDDKPFVPYSEITEWNEYGLMHYYYRLSESDTIDISFTDGKYNPANPVLGVYYNSEKGVSFDGIAFEGANNPLNENHQVKGIALDDIFDYLPTTATWTIKFTNSADPSKNYTHTVSAEDVTAIKSRLQAKIDELAE